MLALLRRREFILVWLAGVISDTGDWLLITGLPIYVFTLTGSVLTTATVFIVEMVPVVMLSSVAGVLVDRWNRRSTMIVISFGQAVLLLPLLLVHHSGQLWLIYLIAAGQAVLAQFFEPAKNAAIPALVERDQVGAANGMVGVSSNFGRLVGSSLGGLALITGALTTIVIGDVATYLAAGLLISAAKFVDAKAGLADLGPRPAPLIEAWKSGIRLITGRRMIRAAFVNAALGSLAQGVFVVLFIVYVGRLLHGDSAEIGLLRGVQAFGGLAGGILVGVLSKKLASRQFVALGAFGIGVFELAIWNAHFVTLAEAVYIGLFIVIGIPGMFNTAGLFTLLQEEVPSSHLGRVIGAFLSVYGGFQALGMLAAGVLGDLINLTVILEFQGGLYVAAGVICWLMTRHPERDVPLVLDEPVDVVAHEVTAVPAPATPR
jgi:MFS family permease